MKRTLAIIICTLSIQTGFAQMMEGEKSAPCAEGALSNLSNCLNSNNIVFEMKDSGNGNVTITAIGNPAPGQIQSCIAHYNQTRRQCPEAPVVVFSNQNGNNKMQDTEGSK